MSRAPKHDIQKIVDAFGEWHDIGATAFDAFNKKLAKPLSFDSAFITGDFKDEMHKTFQLFKEESFVKDSILDKSFSQWVAGLGAAVSGWLAGKTVGALAGGEAGAVAGPIGIGVGVVGELVVEWALEHFKGKVFAPESGHKPGSWIVIDNGSKTKHRPAKRRDIAWGETSMFGDAPDVGEMELYREEDYSVGFIVDPNANQQEGFMQVFNFEREEEQVMHTSKFRLLPQDIALKLDNNRPLSLIREARFRRDSFEIEQTLRGSVCTDPGTEVVDLRDGFRKKIVAAEGEKLLLEDGNGNQVKANISEVAPGRQKSNISYNYLGKDDKGKRVVAGGFKDATAGKLFPGRWVWATPHAAALAVEGVEVKRVLGCVTCLKPRPTTPGSTLDNLPNVILFNAWDGDKLVRLQSEVTAVGFQAEEVLNEQRDFLIFKEAAVSGAISLCQDRAPGRAGAAAQCLGIDLAVLPGEGSWAGWAGEEFDWRELFHTKAKVIKGTPEDPKPRSANQSGIEADAYERAAQAERKSKIAMTMVKDGKLLKTRAATPGAGESGGAGGWVVPGALLAGAGLLLGR